MLQGARQLHTLGYKERMFGLFRSLSLLRSQIECFVYLSPKPTPPNGGLSSGLRNNTAISVSHLVIISEQQMTTPATLHPVPLRGHNVKHEGPSLSCQCSSWRVSLAALTDSLSLRVYTCVLVHCTVVKSMGLESDCMGWNHCATLGKSLSSLCLSFFFYL